MLTRAPDDGCEQGCFMDGKGVAWLSSFVMAGE